MAQHQTLARVVFNPNKHVNIRVIGKLDFATGVQYPNCIPTQKEYERIVKATHESKQFSNGHISAAFAHVFKEFDKMGIDVSGHEDIFRAGSPEVFPSQVY
jgi:hypothetical protein